MQKLILLLASLPSKKEIFVIHGVFKMVLRNSIGKELVFIKTAGNKQMNANTYLALLLCDIDWESAMMDLITILYAACEPKA